MRRFGRRARGSILGLGWFCLIVLGCGSSTATVSGQVRLKGKAVVWGTVTLVDQTGQVHQADIDLAGRYEMRGVAVGPCQLAVISPNPAGAGARGGGAAPKASKAAPPSDDPREKFLAGKAPDQDTRPRPPEGAWFPIDRKYLDIASSGLTGTVSAGSCTIDIELTQ